MRKTIRRVFMCVSILFCLSGCNMNNDSVSETSAKIETRETEIINWDYPVEAIYIENDKVYSVYREKQDVMLRIENFVDVQREIVLKNWPEQTYVKDLYVADNFFFLGQREQRLYYIIYDLEGNIISSVELSSENMDKFYGYEEVSFAVKNAEELYLYCEAYVYPRDLQKFKDTNMPGDYLVQTANILKFVGGKENGTQLQTFSMMETDTTVLYKDMQVVENELLILSSQPSGDMAFLEIYDKDNFQLKEKQELYVGDKHNCKMCINDNGNIYVSSGKEVFQYKKDEGTFCSVLELDALGVEEEKIKEIAGYGEKGFWIVQNEVHDGTQDYTYELIKIGEVNVQKEIVTLGSVYSTYDSQLQDIIAAYNRQSKDYYIQFQDMSQMYNDDLEGAYDRFLLDIIRGHGPDIIELTGMEQQVLGESGVLLDLYELMPAEKLKEKYVENAITCAQVGEKLHGLGYGFNINTLIANSMLTGETSGWSFSEMQAFIKKNGGDENALYGLGGDESYVASLTKIAMTDYVDWENKKAGYDNEEFKQMLEFCKRKEQGSEASVSLSKGLHENYYLAQVVYINSVADYQIAKELFDEHVAFKGYPTEKGTGTIISMLGAMGINAKSEVKDAAFDFLQYYADNYESNVFPILKNKFEDRLVDSMNEEYWDDGEIKAKSSYYDEDDSFDVYAATEEDIYVVKNLVESADRTFTYNETIAVIIEEEASGYLSGVLDIDTAVRNINNRVQLYLDEQFR